MLEAAQVMANLDPAIGKIQVDDHTIGSQENNRPALLGNRNTLKAVKGRRVKSGGTLAEQFGNEALPEGMSDAEVREMAQTVTVSRTKRKETAGAAAMEKMLTPRATIPEEHAAGMSQMPQLDDNHPSVLDASPPPQEEGGTEKLTVDLKKMVLSCVNSLGQAKAGEFFGKDQSTISRWISGKVEPPLEAVQTILDQNVGARKRFLQVIEQVDINGCYSVQTIRENPGVMLCSCVKGDFPPIVYFSHMSIIKRFDVDLAMLPDTILIRSRNIVAQKFLNSGCEWSMWLDSDVVPVLGKKEWFKFVTGSQKIPDKHASYDFLPRLLSHKKHYVGGFYASRWKHGPLVTQPELHPRNKKDREVSDAMRKYQSEGLFECGWLSNGFSLIHRSVFEKIREHYPELTPKHRLADGSEDAFPFFLPTSTEGEDVAFGERAKAVGIKLYLDTELIAGHMGRYLFMPEETEPIPSNNL